MDKKLDYHNKFNEKIEEFTNPIIDYNSFSNKTLSNIQEELNDIPKDTNNIKIYDETIIDKKYLDNDFLELLAKDKLTEEERKKVFEYTLNFTANRFIKTLKDVEIEYIVDQSKPASQLYYKYNTDTLRESGKIIYVNLYRINQYPTEKIVFTAAQQIANIELSRINNPRIKIERGYFSANEVYQCAIDATSDNDLKLRFRISQEILRLDEKSDLASFNKQQDDGDNPRTK